jgi:hypothetical protein
MRASYLSIVVSTALLGSVANCSAMSVFADNFQTDLSQWMPTQGYTGSAAIVADPLGGGGNALTFGQATAHGDIITRNTFGSSGPSTYAISFDYLGSCGQPNCGLYVYDYVSSQSLVSDFAYPVLLQIAATGSWQHVSVLFSTLGPMGLGLEDWNGDNIPGQTFGAPPAVTYLRNLEVSQTPIPAALPLFSTGLGAMGIIAWLRSRRVGRLRPT